MRLGQAINEKISMCDRIILALSSQELGRYHDSGEISDMVDFMRDERERLRTEYRMLEDGTHPIFA
jgi:hypothetical protein|tara:strand:- start:3 stop:200 length:198 start_codon:yes stop_codon:yes gene_type:complete